MRKFCFQDIISESEYLLPRKVKICELRQPSEFCFVRLLGSERKRHSLKRLVLKQSVSAGMQLNIAKRKCYLNMLWSKHRIQVRS